MHMHETIKDGAVWSVSFDLEDGTQVEILFRGQELAGLVTEFLRKAISAAKV